VVAQQQQLQEITAEILEQHQVLTLHQHRVVVSEVMELLAVELEDRVEAVEQLEATQEITGVLEMLVHIHPLKDMQEIKVQHFITVVAVVEQAKLVMRLAAQKAAMVEMAQPAQCSMLWVQQLRLVNYQVEIIIMLVVELEELDIVLELHKELVVLAVVETAAFTTTQQTRLLEQQTQAVVLVDNHTALSQQQQVGLESLL
jgi:hypothetical protein